MSLKLIDAIANGDKALSKMTKEELIEMHHTSIARGDFRALRITTNEFTGLYDYDDHKPYWLCSDFKAPVWQIVINRGEGKKPFYLTFDWQAVVLDDGYPLTDPSHSPLLLAFKYWMTAVDNPRYNGGKRVKGSTLYTKISSVRALINTLLLHSTHLKLSELHLSGLTQEFLLDVFVKLARVGSIVDGLYEHNKRVTALLREHIPSVSNNNAKYFAAKYPYITRHLTPDEQTLGLSLSERIKACCWLHRIGYYQNKNGEFKISNTSGNQASLSPYLYDGKILPLPMLFPVINELRLQPENTNTEYNAVPHSDTSKGVGEARLLQLLKELPLLHSFRDKEGVSQCPVHALKDVNLKRIQQHATIKNAGRFKTLPVKMVFDLTRQTYEFTKDNQDLILNSVLSVVKELQTKSTKPYSNPNYIHSQYKGQPSIVSSSERQEYLRTQALELIAPELNVSNVKEINFPSSTTDNVFTLRRKNPSLLNLYSVLIGCIQVLTGIIMAKRQNELVSLKSHGNLEPNVDPASIKGQQNEFFLKAKLKKSGDGGKLERNATIKRPIPRSFAILIWKLEQFNQAITKEKCNRSPLALFNFIHTHTMMIEQCNENSYNIHLDTVCDFFETPLVNFGGGDIRRYYVRQHQLRRFFAMVFFWSKGFDGLDSLRWMLGHTDIEHLHHYITENESGAVLNGVKASYLRDAMESNKLENIDCLRKLIATRYGVNASDISLNSIKDAVTIYGDEDDYQTLPKIEILQEQEQLESYILELLNDHVISLEPEFFSVYQGDRKINDFSLTLQIKELD
ncbi:hypothetical protein FB443_11057 [Vibrio crassostreae]|uniref:integrase n=1 Tax=Vibrio crassostreae TaxID=246167 RepID=UPI00114FF6B2|nr:integrase [Vibrio crassostreae]TQL30720.1 hypothetical protein FB443_11057 [Vibrio crassostreae]